MAEASHNQKVRAEVRDREQQYEALQRAQVMLATLADGLPPDILATFREPFGGGSLSLIRSRIKESAQAVGEVAEQQRVSVAAARELQVSPLPISAELPHPTAEENFG